MRRIGGAVPAGVGSARLADAVFSSYARYWAELFTLAHLSDAEVAAGIRYEGFGYIEDGLEAGRGVILALPHLGGWEWAGTDLARKGFPMSVVAERLDDQELFRWFVDLRETLGMQVIPTGPRAAGHCTAALRANRVLCLLCDRVVGDSAGVEVEFFGETTMLPAGPAMLSIRSGAPLLPVGVYFGKPTHDHLSIIRPPVEAPLSGRLRADVVEMTQALASELEYLIRLEPSQWHMLQPNWPSDHL
jgi:KDO2-lipid IV(A) lauroyltransferase